LSRLFVGANASRLDSLTIPVTVGPYTIAVWVRIISLTAVARVWTLWNSNSGNEQSSLFIAPNAANQSVTHFNYANAVDTYVYTTTAPTAGVWAHICVVVDNVNDRFIYLNGGSKGTYGSVAAPVGLNRLTLGTNSGGSQPFDGDIAEVSIWNLALLDAEVAMLALAPSALLVRPANLVAHWPLIGYASPEIDLIGRRDLTITTPAAPSPHPRLFMPPDQPTIALSKWGAPLGAAAHTLARFGPEHADLPPTAFMTHAIRNGHRVLEATPGDAAIFAGVLPRPYAGGRVTVTLHWLVK